MAQQTVVKSIPDYPFKVSDTKILTWASTGQYVTAMGAMMYAVDVAASLGYSSGMITGNYSIPNFWQTFTEIRVALVNHVNANGETLQLAKAIPAYITHREDLFFCQNEELGIVTMSSNLEDCIKDFQDEICFVWNEYGKESDDKLTDGAKELKRKIKEYVGK